ncbi:hypothetical protein GN956_G17860 [Arapaima gigas]
MRQELGFKPMSSDGRSLGVMYCKKYSTSYNTSVDLRKFLCICSSLSRTRGKRTMGTRNNLSLLQKFWSGPQRPIKKSHRSSQKASSLSYPVLQDTRPFTVVPNPGTGNREQSIVVEKSDCDHDQFYSNSVSQDLQLTPFLMAEALNGARQPAASNSDKIMELVTLKQFAIVLLKATMDCLRCHQPASLVEVIQVAESHLLVTADGHL